MPNSTTPTRPEGLSDQEEEELRALEKGYDDEASALPDPDPGSDTRRGEEEDGGSRPPAHAGVKPLKDAEQHGLLPPAGTAAPPLDLPDDEDETSVSTDPDAARRRP